MESIIQKLVNSDEPSVRYRTAVGVLDKPAESPEVKALQEEVRHSARVKAMLAPRGVDGRFPWHAYQKWNGSFWTLLVLADMGYPTGDPSLLPLAEQNYEWILHPKHIKSVSLINGRWRRCACQESGVVFAMIKLGLTDSRVEQLVKSLLKWQWPDGGWNCDKHPEASHSSFHESLIPLRALNAYWQASGDPQILKARDRAAERFLSRFLFKNPKTGTVIKPEFVELAYPGYWHYDFLYGLRSMSECGLIMDPRCKDALAVLESKRLPDGGFGADTKYYHFSQTIKTGNSLVDWGGTSRKKMNPFITAEALSILKQAGRL